MSNLMIPAPEGDEPEKTGAQRPQRDHDSDHDSDQADPHPRRPEKSGIPGIEDCLLAMAHTAGLVAMGLLTPARANSIRAAYADILRHHKSQAKEAEQGLANADVMDLLHENPRVLSLLEPLLTADQVAMVMKTAEDSADG